MFDDDDFEKDADNYRDFPVFKKAEVIYDIVIRIKQSDVREEESLNEFERDTILEHIDYMVENASIIPAKIAGAVDADLYDLQMENASFVRMSARELLIDATDLVSLGFRDVDYLQILRNEVDEFRILFAEWVKTFDPHNYVIDRWGLFNPPGVNYNDPDPDDDLPFNPSDLFNDDD